MQILQKLLAYCVLCCIADKAPAANPYLAPSAWGTCRCLFLLVCCFVSLLTDKSSAAWLRVILQSDSCWFGSDWLMSCCLSCCMDDPLAGCMSFPSTLQVTSAVGQAICMFAGPADMVEERAAAAMSAAAQALKPRPGRRAQQQQRPPSPPPAAPPAAAAAPAASMLPGHPRFGAAAAAAGQGAHPAAAVATPRAVPGGDTVGPPPARHIPPGFGNLDGFLPPESRPGQQVGSDVYVLRSLMLAAHEGTAKADSPPARRSLHVWGAQALCAGMPFLTSF